jgi:uncharacterized protein with beta-barrel porin domain
MAAAVALMATTPVYAVAINDRVAAAHGGVANYWDRTNQMSNVVSFFMPGTAPYPGSFCTGTLINSRTILTAAHCLVNPYTNALADYLPLSQIRFNPDARISGSNDRGIVGVAHPEGFHTDHNQDVALVTLDRPVTGVQPVTLLSRGDAGPVQGDLVVIAGYGESTNGSRDTLPDDDRRRIAETLIGKVQPEAYRAQFRDPASPASPDQFELDRLGNAVPVLQGSAGPGDSGGPLFIRRADGSLVQVATVRGGDGDVRYGVTGAWIRLSANRDWLEANNPLRDTAAAAGDHQWSDAGAWTDTMQRRERPDNRDGDVVNGVGDTGRFYRVYLREPGRMTVDVNPTVDALAVDGAGSILALNGGRVLKVIDRTTLNAGRVVLDGRLETDSFGMTGGMLAGAGTLATAGTAVVAGGHVIPGNGVTPGDLVVEGNYQQGDGATLVTRGAGTGASRLVVTGQATLAGGTAMVLSGMGVYLPDVDYTFLSAAGGLTGAFARTGTDLAFLDPQLSTGANSVSFRMQRNATRFASVATSDNGRRVAGALDGMQGNSDLYRSVASSSADQADRAFQLVSGETFASTTSAVLDQTRYLRDAANARARQGESADARSGLWLQPFGAWSRLAGRSGQSSAVNTTTSGLLMGAEHVLSPSTIMGVAAGFGSSDINMAPRQASTKVTNYSVLLYGGTTAGHWRLRWGGGMGQHQARAQRSLSLVGFSDSLSARYQLRTAQVFGEVGRGFQVGDTDLEPFFNLAHARVGAARINEQGGAAALSGQSQARHLNVSTLGLRMTSHLLADDAAKWTLNGMLGWQRVLNEPSGSARLNFSAGGAPFEVTGTPVSRDRLSLEAGVAREVGTRSQLSVGYTSEWARNAQEHGLKARWNMRF